MVAGRCKQIHLSRLCCNRRDLYVACRGVYCGRLVGNRCGQYPTYPLSHFVFQAVWFKPMRCRFSAGLHQAEDPAYPLIVTELLRLREIKRGQQTAIETDLIMPHLKSTLPSLPVNLEKCKRDIALDNIGDTEADTSLMTMCQNNPFLVPPMRIEISGDSYLDHAGKKTTHLCQLRGRFVSTVP